MRRLIVMRHAKAGWPDGVDDADRPLAPEGLGQATRAGIWLSERDLMPDLALVSPALRTRQTWDNVSSSWPQPPPVSFVDDIYSAHCRRLLQVVRERAGEATTVLLVGHNPGVHDLILSLAASRDDTPASYPPATVAVLSFEIDAWEALEPQSGQVESVRAQR